MEQLLKITSVPIAFELKVNNARLQYSNSTAELEMRTDKGGLHIKSSPIKINIDTFEARNSISPTPAESVRQAAQTGRSAAYEATAKIASEGQILLSATLGDSALNQIIASRNDMSPADIGLAFTPKAPPNITWSEPDLTIQYEMDKLNFDWKVGAGNFEFIPGNIELSITQRPDLIIEYVGGPIYVPPSADPSYEPIDVKA